MRPIPSLTRTEGFSMWPFDNRVEHPVVRLPSSFEIVPPDHLDRVGEYAARLFPLYLARALEQDGNTTEAITAAATDAIDAADIYARALNDYERTRRAVAKVGVQLRNPSREVSNEQE